MAKHPHKKLSAAFVRSARDKGRYADGNGLYLVVDASGAKRWMLRTVVRGKRTDLGLGSVRLVSLAEARETAAELRKIARSGGDPLAEKRRRNATIPTFKEAAEQVHSERAGAWRNEKHRAQWLNTLKAYAYPVFGDRRIDQVSSADVLRVLSGIWLMKAETARRLAQRMAAVFDWATAAGHREGENPVKAALIGLPKQPERKRHFKALPYSDVPDFIKTLRGSNAADVVRLAFEFLILTAARTSEVINATWDEIDLDARVWTVPGDRMKSGQEHRVPLSGRVVKVLQSAQNYSHGTGFLFPGRRAGKPLSSMAFLMVLRRMEHDVTAHGFRSSFRDWASECTHYPREVCEAALAHVVKDKTEAAYRRGDLFEKRRELMEAWALFAASNGAKILTLPHAQTENEQATG